MRGDINMNKIRKCPFCGKEAEVGEGFECYKGFEVKCSDYDCYLGTGAGYSFDTEEEAIEAWNSGVVKDE